MAHFYYHACIVIKVVNNQLEESMCNANIAYNVQQESYNPRKSVMPAPLNPFCMIPRLDFM